MYYSLCLIGSKKEANSSRLLGRKLNRIESSASEMLTFSAPQPQLYAEFASSVLWVDGNEEFPILPFGGDSGGGFKGKGTHASVAI